MIQDPDRGTKSINAAQSMKIQVRDDQGAARFEYAAHLRQCSFGLGEVKHETDERGVERGGRQ